MAQGMLFNIPWAFFHYFPSLASHFVAAPIPILQAVACSSGAGCWCSVCGGHCCCLFWPVCVLVRRQQCRQQQHC